MERENCAVFLFMGGWGKNGDIEIETERERKEGHWNIRLADYCKLLKLYLQSPQLGNLNRGFKYLENIFCCS